MCAASGLDSVPAEVAGNNTSGALFEDDMLRERLAVKIGTAGDSEVMSHHFVLGDPISRGWLAGVRTALRRL